MDVSDSIFLLLGSAVHYILEKGETAESLVEQRMTIEVDGWVLSGKPDLLLNKILSDYKTCTVYGIQMGDKPEWHEQLNIYRYMFEKHGFEVNEAQVVAIIKDFSKGRAASDRNYPSAPVQVIPIPLWTMKETEDFIRERIRIHQAAVNVPDDELPYCTDRERWCNSDWAIVKNGASRATRKFDSFEEAESEKLSHFNDGNYEIVQRRGRNTRCESYCPAANFCNQWAEIQRGS